MRKLVASLLLLSMACKRTSDPKPLPMVKGRCFVMDYIEDRSAYQWCQYDNFWYECWTGAEENDSCKRRQMLTDEDKAAAEKPADPITKK